MLMRWPSLLELQAFLVEMVNNFEFELTEKATRIRREACLVMVPTVEGEVDKGAQLPMRVRVASREWTMMTPFLFFSFHDVSEPLLSSCINHRSISDLPMHTILCGNFFESLCLSFLACVIPRSYKLTDSRAGENLMLKHAWFQSLTEKLSKR